MLSVLIVEENKEWQETEKRSLEKALGNVNIDIAETLDTAMHLVTTNNYDAYIIGSDFPWAEGKKSETLGLTLANHIANTKSSYDKILIVSGRDETLDEAQRLGMITYTKGTPNPSKNYRNLLNLGQDIKAQLVAEQPL